MNNHYCSFTVFCL